MTNFDWLFDDEPLEKSDIPVAKTLRRAAKLQCKAALKREKAAEILTGLPAPGESWHIVSNGQFDYWSFAPVVIGLMGGRTDLFCGSTWTMNRTNAVELMSLYDAGAIGEIILLTGLYFKRRETAVYAFLVQELQARGQRFAAFHNHAKVMLFANSANGHYITIEGSANWTANPRLEQYVISNDRNLVEFHAEWMQQILKTR